MNNYTDKTRKYSVRLEESKVEYLQKKYGTGSFTVLIEKLMDDAIIGQQEEKKKLSSPIIRIGGKGMIAGKIVDVMPKHHTYVDVFAGACHVLFAKPKDSCVLEVINDKSKDIINLFQCVKKKPLELRAKLCEMPCSRAYFNFIKGLPVSSDPVERAARFVYIVRNSYYGDPRSGWRASTKNSPSRTLQNVTNDLIYISERLRNVSVECKDWKYILKKYDSPDTLYYCDPPYIIRGKPHGIYELPFDTADGRELSKRLHNIQGKVMVSHYENQLYNRWYKDWSVYQIPWFKAAGAVTNGNKPKVIENIYCNFELCDSEQYYSKANNLK